MLILAIKFPRPTPFQYTVFRIVLALAEIQTFWQGMIDQGARDVKLVTIGTASSGNVGYEAGSYEFTMGPASQPARDNGKYVVGWKRGGDGEWKLAYDIFNSNLPCAPAPK